MMDLLGKVSEQRLASVRRGVERLSPMEFQVLKRAIEGETARETAGVFGVSQRTVEAHRSHALSKLKERRMTQAVRLLAFCREEGDRK